MIKASYLQLWYQKHLKYALKYILFLAHLNVSNILNVFKILVIKKNISITIQKKISLAIQKDISGKSVKTKNLFLHHDQNTVISDRSDKERLYEFTICDITDGRYDLYYRWYLCLFFTLSQFHANYMFMTSCSSLCSYHKNKINGIQLGEFRNFVLARSLTLIFLIPVSWWNDIDRYYCPRIELAVAFTVDRVRSFKSASFIYKRWLSNCASAALNYCFFILLPDWMKRAAPTRERPEWLSGNEPLLG